MSIFLGIDVGSSGCKVTAVNENGIVVNSASQAYATRYPQPGWAEQDPRDWYRSACQAIQVCLGNGAIDPRQIAGISFDGPAHNVALLDDQNEIIYPTIHWSDNRSFKQSQFLISQFPDKIRQITYHQPNPSWTLAQLLWLKENEPAIWKKLRRIQVTKDYVRLGFTGNYLTDVYDAIGTQLYDVEKKCWSEEICEIIGFRREWLPKVMDAVSIAGWVTPAAANDTGLIPGTPVAVGSGDSIIEAFGVGAVQPGQCVVKIATSATVALVTPSPMPTTQTITYPHLSGKNWYSIAATNSGASTMRWFTETFCKHEETLAEAEGKVVFSRIDDLAQTVMPGCDGLMFHPYLMGERTPYWDPLLRGDFIGITSYHSLAHFARAIMEGVAFSLLDCFSVIREMAPSIDQIRMIGGGTKSLVWSQILCDVFGLPLSKPTIDDAAYGSALWAGVAAGVFDTSPETLGKLIQVEKEFTPNLANHALYLEYFDIYQSVARELVEANHRIAVLTRKD